MRKRKKKMKKKTSQKIWSREKMKSGVVAVAQSKIQKKVAFA